jgi:RNA polymerase sigma-70 factor (ECF subfamily)
MPDEPTTAAVQRYLDVLPGDAAAEPVVRELLGRAAGRLRLLCAPFLYKGYPRLARPPVNPEADDLLGGVVAGLLTALRKTRPRRCDGSSPWPAGTCGCSSMTWPAA